jgi:Pretoxin HINT domain
VAGTKLWTPGGYRSIETLLPGDLVYSRDEWNPSAAVEAKVVEEVFTRFAGILHVHLGGQVIGTSGEHPFYVDGRGWVPAGELQPGESVLCADGSLVLVEEVYDTGEWQPVYNLRVADHHTYFIGEESWGHNAYEMVSGRKIAEMVTQGSNAVNLTEASKKQILDLVLEEGANHGAKYGAVANYANLSSLLKSATQNQAMPGTVIEQTIKDYFKKNQVKRSQVELPKVLNRNWSDYISNTYSRDARGKTKTEYEAEMQSANKDPKTHGHHIVFKMGAAGGSAKEEGRDSRDILLYYGIDPYEGKENLTFAPNDGHPKNALVYMRNKLVGMYNGGTTRALVVAELVKFANRFILKDWTSP